MDVSNNNDSNNVIHFEGNEVPTQLFSQSSVSQVVTLGPANFLNSDKHPSQSLQYLQPLDDFPELCQTIGTTRYFLGPQKFHQSTKLLPENRQTSSPWALVRLFQQ
mmetsp:Transcript_37941/g.68323  ORF Transcript_37941/g.68323 Transcript_37941/m.68323 type:complete len:106 (-) Transcript_37941:201-518(-)